jgi:Low-density lipoprotein receptor domain class A
VTYDPLRLDIHSSLYLSKSLAAVAGHFECVDGSDEIECPQCLSGSNSSSWTCNNGQCIRASERCDRNFDCDDFSDEVNCTCDVVSQWTCANGIENWDDKLVDKVTLIF